MNAEQLLAHFDRISNAPDAIPLMRGFILDLAVRGKLVEQDPNDGPASVLMKTIDVARRQFSTAGEFSSQGFEILNEPDVPFEIPPNWIWVQLGDVCSKTGSGSTPEGGSQST